MTKRDIIKAMKYRLEIEELKKEIKDLERDSRMVKTKSLQAVILNSIKAKEVKMDRIKDLISELEASDE